MHMSSQSRRDDCLHNSDSSSCLWFREQPRGSWLLLSTKLKDIVRGGSPAVLVVNQRIDSSPLVLPTDAHSQEIVQVLRIERHLDIVVVFDEVRRGAIE